MSEVVIYSSNWCGYCMRAKSLLASKGVEFTEIVVDGDVERRREMERRSGRSTVPQIFIGETHVGGCDDLYALAHADRLDPLLAGT